MKIELHDRIVEALPSRLTDITSSVFPRDAEPGLNSYPSNTALMMHITLHAAGAMVFRSLRALHLQDMFLLASRMTARDWDEFSRAGGADRSPWWALPPLALMVKYHPSSVPESVLAAAHSACHERLRKATQHRMLTDVSLSYLWLEAFPGGEWARTRSELLEHVVRRTASAGARLVSRLVPRERTKRLQNGGAPQVSRSAYILGWLFFPQARPDTMFAIHAALAQID